MANYTITFTIKRLWVVLTVSVALMFGTLLFLGREIYQVAPPIPLSVQTTAGSTLYTRDDIQRGQNNWQSTGGMQQGSIWGHGGLLLLLVALMRWRQLRNIIQISLWEWARII